MLKHVFKVSILFVTMLTLASCADINWHWQGTGYEAARQNCKGGKHLQDYHACLAEVDRNYGKAN